MKFRKLGSKIVINTNTGEMMGYVVDLDIEMKTFQIKNLTIEDKGGILAKIVPWMFKGKVYTISTNQISSIGNDVILVINDEKRKNKG